MLDLLESTSYIDNMERAERFRKIKLDMSLKELKRAQNDMDVSYQDLLYMDIIYFHPETTVSYIADVLNIAGTAVTVRLNRMEKNGWIKKLQSPDDRRQALIYITDEGKQARLYIREQRRKRADAFFEVLSDEEKQTLLELLNKINSEREG